MSALTLSALDTGPALLGEAPVWDDRLNRLYWVDIKSHELHWLEWLTGRSESLELEEDITAVALVDNESLLCALRSGLYRFDLQSGEFHKLTEIEIGLPANRPNDGGVDPLGRFWIGTMDDTEKRVAGSLYCWDGLALSKNLGGVGVSNGVDWSADGKTMYFTDSWVRTIWKLSFDTATGQVTGKQPFVIVPDTQGFPDGLTIDADGYIWSVHWDGGCMTRYAPDGSVDRAIDLPVQRPTACAFAGPDLDQLVITTASIGLTREQLHGAPLSGALLCCTPGVKGVPARRVSERVAQTTLA